MRGTVFAIGVGTIATCDNRQATGLGRINHAWFAMSQLSPLTAPAQDHWSIMLFAGGLAGTRRGTTLEFESGQTLSVDSTIPSWRGLSSSAAIISQR